MTQDYTVCLFGRYLSVSAVHHVRADNAPDAVKRAINVQFEGDETTVSSVDLDEFDYVAVFVGHLPDLSHLL